jgi:F-type H+-transporting ATPase subunit gamma
MPALIDLRRRIRSVRSTQKITRAMKMVSAAKLRRAQEAVFSARPFARKVLEVLNSAAARCDSRVHPLLAERGDERILVILVTADKGLCGGFNSNLIRAAARFIEEHAKREVKLVAVGRKARDYFRRREVSIRSEHVGVFTPLVFATAKSIADELIEDFTTGAADQVYLIYNEFKSVIQQRLVVSRLLPIEHDPPETGVVVDYKYEPSAEAIYARLLPRHIEQQIWRALLESAAAEHGARMTAMDAATDNATDVIDSLTLHMNKMRQAAITKEIIEVVSGAGV